MDELSKHLYHISEALDLIAERLGHLTQIFEMTEALERIAAALEARNERIAAAEEGVRE